MDNLPLKCFKWLLLLFLIPCSHVYNHARVCSLERVQLILLSPRVVPYPLCCCIWHSYMCSVVPLCVSIRVSGHSIRLWIFGPSSWHAHVMVCSRLVRNWYISGCSMFFPLGNFGFKFFLVVLCPLSSMILVISHYILSWSVSLDTGNYLNWQSIRCLWTMCLVWFILKHLHIVSITCPLWSVHFRVVFISKIRPG